MSVRRQGGTRTLASTCSAPCAGGASEQTQLQESKPVSHKWVGWASKVPTERNPESLKAMRGDAGSALPTQSNMAVYTAFQRASF